MGRGKREEGVDGRDPVDLLVSVCNIGNNRVSGEKCFSLQ